MRSRTRSGSPLTPPLPSRRRAIQLIGAPVLTAAVPGAARAASYPDGPITLVIPSPPGGVLDVIARGCSERFRRDLKSSFVIENVPGATGNIGAARVAHARPDGSTALLTISSPISTNVFMFKSMPFDPDKDLAPVIITSTSPLALVAHSSFPARSVAEYISYAKAHPGDLACGGSGIGSPHQICAGYLSFVAGISLNYIPYKGSPESAAGVIAGHVPSAITALGLVTEQAKAGIVRVLAITDDQRNPAYPDIPTIGETVPQFAHAPGAWNGMFVPAGTPKADITILNREMNIALRQPDLVAKLANIATYPVGGAPEDVTEKIRFERDITRRVADKLGLVPQ